MHEILWANIGGKQKWESKEEILLGLKEMVRQFQHLACLITG